MKISKEKSGFTLIEMLVAMSIFVVFVGILINSYTSILRAYTEANQYREVYVEARDIFETLSREIRDGMYDYNIVNPKDTDKRFLLVSKDGMYRTEICYDEGDSKLSLIKSDFKLAGTEYVCSTSSDKDVLNYNTRIADFKYYITPSFDPYDIDNVSFDNQFQPMITFYIEFQANEGSLMEDQSFALQTTITSRIYNQVYEKASSRH